MKKLYLLVLITGLINFSFADIAAIKKVEETRVGEVNASTEIRIKAALRRVRPDITIEKIVKSPLNGLVEAHLLGGQVLYFSTDARYLVSGEIYRLGANELVNLTEERRIMTRKKIMAELDESEMWVFAPAEGQIKATVTVFTDIDCVFCRKLHNEIPELNRLGIAVRYMAFPRAGLESESYNKIVSAWCAADPKLALTRAKGGQEIPALNCDNPVAEQYALGSALGVNATPALLFEDGSLVPGYLPARDLASKLGLL
ncbi:MAG: thioredoxin fold domain-containing protein [Pseudomonadales bacterium]|nr:thioredoxin fold domain-containing protein [Pseudomonadales bacterium]